MEGMMATSTAPVRSASAHSDGTVKESSQRPAKGPLVNPQTSGAVFRYSTMEMRSLLTSSAFSLPPPSFGNNHYHTRRLGEWMQSVFPARCAAMEAPDDSAAMTSDARVREADEVEEVAASLNPSLA